MRCRLLNDVREWFRDLSFGEKSIVADGVNISFELSQSIAENMCGRFLKHFGKKDVEEFHPNMSKAHSE